MEGLCIFGIFQNVIGVTIHIMEIILLRPMQRTSEILQQELPIMLSLDEILLTCSYITSFWLTRITQTVGYTSGPTYIR